MEQNPYESSSNASYLDRDEQSILDRASTRFVLINQMTSAALIVGLLTYAGFSYSQNYVGVIPRPPTSRFEVGLPADFDVYFAKRRTPFRNQSNVHSEN